MTYPRRCPLCGADYRVSISGRGGVRVPSDSRHATQSAEPGGTPSPWRPRQPGRLLTLACTLCRGEYAWDYFAGQPAAGAALAPRLPQRESGPPRRRTVALPGSPSRVY
jgi:hypothetical protein